MMERRAPHWVRIQFVSGVCEYVRAHSFGEAARRVSCGPGQIEHFMFVVDPIDPQEAAR